MTDPAGPLRVDDGLIDVALVVPLSGPAGLFGPSSELCAQLAVHELNAGGGLLGRSIRLIVVDGGAAPERVADEVDFLVTCGAVMAVVGWHTSAVRQALVRRVAGRVPYIYTALYEGGESTPGVFLTGETPRNQILPALQWMSREFRVPRWSIVGNDYVWPRRSAAAAQCYLRACGAKVVSRTFVELGTTDFSSVLARVDSSDCDAVLMLLLGSDAVYFNRQFSAAQLDQRCIRLSPLMDENMALATGAANTEGLYASAGYFEGLKTSASQDFRRRYEAKFGACAPVLNSPGESCYEGVRLLHELVVHAGSTSLPAICSAAYNIRYHGPRSIRYHGPRGEVSLSRGHLDQPIWMAAARGVELEVVSCL